mmetsp:Transcript_148968/g.415109  ORF Transcript_148968/g.415109 Transcript_148968/m.415109 type:complete len:203 (+) Transcript_148968:1049-1657(+)
MYSPSWDSVCCDTYTIRNLLCCHNSPPSGKPLAAKRLAKMDSSVDLPEPFLPTMAMRLLDVTSTVTPASTGTSAPSCLKDAFVSVSTTGSHLPVPGIFSGAGKTRRSGSGAERPSESAAVDSPFAERPATSRSWCALVSSPPSSRVLKASKSPGWYFSFPSGVKWIMSVQIWFKKAESCETMMAVPPPSPPTHVLLMKSASH